MENDLTLPPSLSNTILQQYYDMLNDEFTTCMLQRTNISQNDQLKNLCGKFCSTSEENDGAYYFSQSDITTRPMLRIIWYVLSMLVTS